jgi:hypothetical protein
MLWMLWDGLCSAVASGLCPVLGACAVGQGDYLRQLIHWRSLVLVAVSITGRAFLACGAQSRYQSHADSLVLSRALPGQ